MCVCIVSSFQVSRYFLRLSLFLSIACRAYRWLDALFPAWTDSIYHMFQWNRSRDSSSKRLRSISVSLSMIIVEWNYGGFGQSRRKSNRTRCTVLIINDFNRNKTRNDFETVAFEARNNKTFVSVDRRGNNNWSLFKLNRTQSNFFD